MKGHLRGLPRASTTLVNTEASALLRRRRVSRACYACALSAALNSVSIGYDIGVSAGVAPELQQDLALSNAQVELFVGALNFIACFGVFLSPLFSDRYGRRAALAAAAWDSAVLAAPPPAAAAAAQAQAEGAGRPAAGAAAPPGGGRGGAPGEGIPAWGRRHGRRGAGRRGPVQLPQEVRAAPCWGGER